MRLDHGNIVKPALPEEAPKCDAEQCAKADPEDDGSEAAAEPKVFRDTVGVPRLIDQVADASAASLRREADCVGHRALLVKDENCCVCTGLC